MGEVSDEIELDLGLSIGRSFKKSEDPRPIEKESAFLEQPSGGKVCGLGSSNHAPSSTAGSGGAVLDPETKREIHALRRQEAKRKREEKQQKRGQSKGRNGEMCFNGGSSVSDDEKTWVGKAPPQDEVRVRVREHEEEFDAEEGQCKKNKIESSGSMNPNSNQDNVGSEQMGYASSPPYPIMQMRFPYPPIQYVPISSGFAIPYVMPCWAPNGAAGGGGGSEKQVAPPVAWRSFVPFQANMGSGVNLANGCESEQNGSGGNRKASSNGSPMCSSSVVSDNRSSSHEGVNSSETRSHSSHPLPQMADVAKVQFDHSASSNIVQPTQSFVKAVPNEKPAASDMSSPNPARPNGKATASNILIPNPPRPNEKPAPSNMNLARSIEKAAPAPSNVLHPNPTGTNGGEVSRPKYSEKPVSSYFAGAESESQPSPAKNKPVSPPENQKEAEGEIGKAPKPQTESQSSPSLPQMPCVSTTGNGPNGKTITGLLYRYTKAEVSIVCVCHGNSFSPAEFVAHAGGTDVSNPLKHITVVPSALG